MRNFHYPGRSPARGLSYMAATSHPAATTAALAVLSSGGNAADAALAAAGVLSVVEPQMTSIGGDCFAIIAQPDGKLHGVNGSGRAPARLNAQMLRDEGFAKVPPTHPHAITVPGALRGFEHIASRFGTRRLEDLLEPAIKLAHDGWIVADRVGHDMANPKDPRDVGSDNVLKRVFRPSGHVPQPGDRLVWPQLAQTLRTIQRDGVQAFYTGEIARDIVAHIRDLGGVMSLSDFATCKADAVTPIMADYRGLTIAELPPNGQGITALMMMKVLERFDVAAMKPQSAERFHLELEAGRAAYSVRDALVGDADTTVDPHALLDDAVIDALVGQVDLTNRSDGFDLPDIPNSDTVYVATADSSGQMVSLIYSIYDDFGALTATDVTGIVLQNRGACFSLEAGHPNELMGGKRPMHTIIPAMALKEGVPVMAFGVMGGAYQPVGHAHVISNMVDFHMDVQQALDEPRVFWQASDQQPIVEEPLSDETMDGLRALGHAPSFAKRAIGGGQAIWRDRETGVFTGGSDPRKDGCAAGL
ncbi:MAG: gamma-glutamyltransferase [Pseudomonadota bacterium]